MSDIELHICAKVKWFRNSSISPLLTNVNIKAAEEGHRHGTKDPDRWTKPVYDTVSLITTGLNRVSHRLGLSVLLFRASVLRNNLTIIVIKVPALVEPSECTNVCVGLKKRLQTDMYTGEEGEATI